MIDIYDCETLVKIYRSFDKRCRILDNLIHNHAYYCGPYADDYGAVDVYNDILSFMERKNQLINIKLIMDQAIKNLPADDQQVIYAKTRCNISMTDFCRVLGVKSRTAFRRIERAYANLTDVINRSKYVDKLSKTIEKEEWIRLARAEVKARRLAFKGGAASSELDASSM